MAKPGTQQIDPFTLRRLERFIDDHRTKTGQLPTLKDFAEANFSEDFIDRATREKLIEQLYVTLTNGTVVKGYKFRKP